MKKLITICLVFVCVLSTINTVLADDLYPPTWRYQPGSTAQGWDNWNYFPSMPCDWRAANPTTIQGYPWADAYTGASFLSEFGGRTNVIELTGDNQLEFSIPNFEMENPEKLMRIQVTYYDEYGFQLSFPRIYQDNPGDLTVYTIGRDSYFLGNNWWIDVWDYQILPNPTDETVRLNFFNIYTGLPLYPAYVDQVVIDTWCVPEPATLSLLGLGALSLVRRRK